MATVEPQQLRALVGMVVRSDDHRSVVAVRSDGSWHGPAVLDGPRPVSVQVCASPLAVRAAMADRSDDSVLAVLTPCSDHELGPDVLARIAKGRVLSVDPFSAVLALFDAVVLDPALTRDERWLVDDLIEIAPPGGWSAVRPPNGMLDVDRAWEVWHTHRFAGRAMPTDLVAVLDFVTEPAVAHLLDELGEVRRARIATRWAGGADPVDVILDVVGSGRSQDAIALGSIAGVLWAATDDPVIAQQQALGRARFEGLLGRDQLSTQSAAAWAEATAVITARPDAPPAHLDRAQQLLTDAAVGSLAVLSDQLSAGFDQRLAALGAALTRRNLAQAEHVLAWLAAHRLAPIRRRQMSTASAAVRILRRSGASAAESGAVGGFADAVRAYAADGAWVDEARRLLNDGDQPAEIGAAYSQLCQDIDGERRAFDRRFASLLADWSVGEPSPHDGLAPLEHLLTDVVAPVALAAPVLFVVCDGMSLAVGNELLRDLRTESWVPAAPIGAARWPTGVALLPTVTEVSRTSLFCGRRVEGGQPEERAGFAAHPALRAASAAARPPVLFHKGQLVGPNGWALADDVRAIVADAGQRVVGVVINAVDDHLNRGQQVQVEWGLETMRPLRWLLDAALEAGRVVVVTADHGHVIHGEGAILRPAGADQGERWRTAPPVAAEDEIEIAGPRVLKGGRVVLPADERIRYGGHKHGYHGGATPQEVLVPVAVVARVLPPGWEYRPLAVPTWWSGAPEAVPTVASVATDAPAPRPLPPVRRTAQPTLFEPEPAVTPMTTAPVESAGAASWAEGFVNSPTFVAHQARTRLPRPLAPGRVAAYLGTIHANGGTIPLVTLAARIGEPADQSRMTLTMVQRLVNVDGAEVLAIRSDQSVELNVELLATQFEVELS